MTHDIHTLIQILRAVLIVAAVSATSFPFVYSFFPWRRSLIGRVLMTYAISLAVALDVSCLFAYWRPKNILIQFWVDVICFTFIAIASALMTAVMIGANYKSHRKLRRTK